MCALYVPYMPIPRPLKLVGSQSSWIAKQLRVCSNNPPTQKVFWEWKEERRMSHRSFHKHLWNHSFEPNWNFLEWRWKLNADYHVHHEDAIDPCKLRMNGAKCRTHRHHRRHLQWQLMETSLISGGHPWTINHQCNNSSRIFHASGAPYSSVFISFIIRQC